MEKIEVKTNIKLEIVDITEKIALKIKEHGEQGSACLIFVPHTTAGIIINEYEPNIKQDYVDFFKNIAPVKEYMHNKIDSNAEAHLLSALIKPSIVIPLENRKPILGIWQRILFVEGDGPRTRTVYIKVLK